MICIEVLRLICSPSEYLENHKMDVRACVIAGNVFATCNSSHWIVLAIMVTFTACTFEIQ